MFSEHLTFFSTRKASEWDLPVFADRFGNRQTFEKALYWCLEYIANSKDWSGDKGDKARKWLMTPSLKGRYWFAKVTKERLQAKNLIAYEKRGDVGEHIFEADVVPELIRRRGQDETSYSGELEPSDNGLYTDVSQEGSIEPSIIPSNDVSGGTYEVTPEHSLHSYLLQRKDDNGYGEKASVHFQDDEANNSPSEAASAWRKRKLTAERVDGEEECDGDNPAKRINDEKARASLLYRHLKKKNRVIQDRTRRQRRSTTILPEIHQPVGNSDDEESSDTSYSPSSSHSADSTDSIEKSYERIEWLVGLGSEESVLSEVSKHWVVDDVSVSEMLMEYRQDCIEKARAANLENSAEILALNHVFLFEDDKESNLREMFDGELWVAVVDDIEKQFVSYRLSDDDILRCHAMSEAASHTFEDCKLLLRKWQQQAGDDTLTEFFENV
ncbi:hypothetical protein BC938DRAFT_479249 [Jimgerdemannia flammicorona]|uniref:Uncharacterized protein n=1 Tax=Jimgerdemannia flammicorona TaxID=994334 RepID=A0A433QLA9_9FUNG|nr:hypothetical protein BC938DRAFT_479249 [Jimgerdemannia flammicorona]